MVFLDEFPTSCTFPFCTDFSHHTYMGIIRERKKFPGIIENFRIIIMRHAYYIYMRHYQRIRIYIYACVSASLSESRLPEPSDR